MFLTAVLSMMIIALVLRSLKAKNVCDALKHGVRNGFLADCIGAQERLLADSFGAEKGPLAGIRGFAAAVKEGRDSGLVFKSAAGECGGKASHGTVPPGRRAPSRSDGSKEAAECAASVTKACPFLLRSERKMLSLIYQGITRIAALIACLGNDPVSVHKAVKRFTALGLLREDRRYGSVELTELGKREFAPTFGKAPICAPKPNTSLFGSEKEARGFNRMAERLASLPRSAIAIRDRGVDYPLVLCSRDKKQGAFVYVPAESFARDFNVAVRQAFRASDNVIVVVSRYASFGKEEIRGAVGRFAAENDVCGLRLRVISLHGLGRGALPKVSYRF